MLKTFFLSPNYYTDTQLTDLVTVINNRYDDTESLIWNAPGTRTNLEHLKGLIATNSVIVATLHNKLAGCIHVSHLQDEETGIFGMLVTYPEFSGKGIGGALVKAAEHWAIEQDYKYMRLELLLPKYLILESKEFLKRWYTKLGYRQTSITTFEKVYPHKKDYMAIPCDFAIWRKKLG